MADLTITLDILAANGQIPIMALMKAKPEMKKAATFRPCNTLICMAWVTMT